MYGELTTGLPISWQIAVTGSLCPLSVLVQPPVSQFQILIVLSYDALAIFFLSYSYCRKQISETIFVCFVHVSRSLKQSIGSHIFIVISKLELISKILSGRLVNINFEMMSLCATNDYGAFFFRRSQILITPSLEPVAT